MTFRRSPIPSLGREIFAGDFLACFVRFGFVLKNAFLHCSFRMFIRYTCVYVCVCVCVYVCIHIYTVTAREREGHQGCHESCDYTNRIVDDYTNRIVDDYTNRIVDDYTNRIVNWCVKHLHVS
jgi:hypothetical protein